MISFNSFCQLNDKEIRDLKTGRIKDDSSYIYWLPYEKGSKYLFIQGANSSFSHKGELSFDFKMKKGSAICASREGTVIATKSDSDKGGLKNEFLSDGNHIVIKHQDGSVAQYWHLEQNGVLVKVGELVKKGQVIGLSGNTGYTAFPHLHFQIIGANGKEILPRFQTKKGVIYLRPGRWYKSVNY
jgi:murein DD-endopeptidase MepM/ murein hydrolase activator NlpD